MRRLFLILALPLALAGCATGPQSVPANVTRFHALPPVMRPMTFTILPERGQVGSLEFQAYAEQVAHALSLRGWTPVPPTDGAPPAETVVFLDYGAGEGRTVIDSTPVYGPSVGFGTGWGRRSRWSGMGVNVPFGHAPFDDDLRGYRTSSRTLYTRQLQVDILDGPAWRAGETRKLFEGRAWNEGQSRDLPAAMPVLVRALFENFPGPSGQTVRVQVPVAPGM